MKIKYVANDGKVCDSEQRAKRRDVCCELENLLKGVLPYLDAKHLEEFVRDQKRVNAVITGILKAVAEVDEIGKVVEKEEIPF